MMIQNQRVRWKFYNQCYKSISFITNRTRIVKTYRGDRTIDGIVVTVDGSPLDQFLDIKEFTDQGFEWAYKGNEPRQLALALLADHGVNPERAITLSEPYMTRVTSKLDNTWHLTSADIDTILTIID